MGRHDTDQLANASGGRMRVVRMPARELAESAIDQWRPGGRAEQFQHLAHFIRYADREQFDLSDAVALQADGRLWWFCFCIRNPGWTALLVLAPLPGGNRADLLPALAGITDMETEHGTILLQALLPTGQTEEGELLQHANYRHLAELIYLEGPLDVLASPRREPGDPPPVRTLADAGQDAFEQTIAATYRDTLDCPGLEGVRPTEDVLAGHRNSGIHRPDLWFLYGSQDHPIGVALLNEVSDTHGRACELVYMGVTPEARGQGHGRRMLLHAVRVARAAGYRRLMLAVDARNTPAVRIYQSMGLRETTRRVAWIFPTSNSPAYREP